MWSITLEYPMITLDAWVTLEHPMITLEYHPKISSDYFSCWSITLEHPMITLEYHPKFPMITLDAEVLP